MELVKNIFFNTDKIVENSKLKISYVGNLYQNGSEEVFLHYGFGLQWDELADIKMEKTELGFQCEIDIKQYESLNLCFRNSNNEWDNNNGENYIFDIEKVSKEDENLGLIVAEDNEMQIHKGLRKSYIWSKKVRIAVYKIIKFFPKIISGNYKRRVSE
ncbi:MAG: hypothetical protein HFJ41_03170 [Clostridia bacterium]|nr:hypothetical protein [Clostridia bacterium]